MSSTSRAPARSRLLPALVALTAASGTAALGGCGETMELAYGDVTSIIVATDSSTWTAIGDSLESELQPTVFTVRDEKAFQVSHVAPSDPSWANLSKFRQMLLIGTPSDPWMQDGLAELDEGELGEPPALAQVYDVWARNQLMTLLVLPEGAEPDAVLGLLPELRARYDRQFREWGRSRMFVSGRNSALADSLATRFGFSLFLPSVYDWDSKDSIYTFRNDNPDPSELIRQVTVTWRSPLPTPVETYLDPDSVMAWREEVARDTYAVGQVVDSTSLQESELRYRGHDGRQVQGIWVNPPSADWPAAGPFITRAIACREQDRLYLIDAWLYAPGREKYEYMLQLQTLLASFRCDGQPAREPPLDGI